MEDLETSSALEFHGVEYIVTVSVRNQELYVQAEVEDYGKKGASAATDFVCWTGHFPAAYVEELTRKTGNVKRFPIFVNMLLSALTRRSDAVFIDLLTTADLELYRKRKMGVKPHDSLDSLPHGPSTTNKRYLILTYAVEFDRVHYPLPLSFVETPTLDILQRTIRRLRQALTAATVGGGMTHSQLNGEDATALREENRCLKNTLKQYCGSENMNRSNVANGFDFQRELQASVKENKELIGMYQQLREESTAEIQHLQDEIKRLQGVHVATRTDAEDDTTRFWEHQLEQERLETRRRLNESDKTVQATLSQLKLMKSQLEETQLKNRELLRQLAVARVNGSNASQRNMLRGSSPYRTPPPAHTSGRASNGGGNRPLRHKNATQPPAPMRQTRGHPDVFYEPFDAEDDGNVYAGNPSTSRRPQGQQPRAFRRFDPTAYQQEKQRKQQARASSPHQAVGGRSRRNSGGYTSDSSGGGYSSADSQGSKSSTRSTRSRGRPRISAEQQRKIDARLSSPKKAQVTNDSNKSAPRRFQSPLPRPAPIRSNSRSRSPSPGANHRNSSDYGDPTATSRAKTILRNASPRQPPPTPVTSKKKPSGKRLPTTKSLLADTSVDSFSDIDERLSALQQFLKEAKKGTTPAAALKETPPG